VHLVTAAEGAEEFYTLENNKARTESPEEARLLDSRTMQAWRGHPHHIIINNSTGFDTKLTRALQSMARVLHMPVPLEKERKFLIHNWNSGLLPPDVVVVYIEQTYLRPGPNGEERRVRLRSLDTQQSYYYTVKAETGEVGVRTERETEISLSRYEELLLEKDPNTQTIEKLRHCFQYEGRTFEVDVYLKPVVGVTIAEVEVEDMNEEIIFPPHIRYTEVTGDKKYSNHAIASGSFV
jgi:CYTH domain-containing protein